LLVVYVARDLAGDTRRLLGLDIDASVIFVLVHLLVVFVIQGRCRRPIPVPVGIAEVAGAPLWAPFPRQEIVPVRGRDGEVRVAVQVHRQKGTLLAYLLDAFRPFQ
jgi:hypothetical protein